MALEIKTSEYMSKKRILVDGMDWEMTVPGAGEELAMSQAQRRVKRLDQKIKAGTATDEDYDLYDRLENDMLKRLSRIFSDGTPENASVKKWLNETPMVVVTAALNDLKKQAEDKAEAERLAEEVAKAGDNGTADDTATKNPA